MARKTITDLGAWPSISLEGNLIAPEIVARIAEPNDDAETRAGYSIRKGLTIREEMSTAFRVGQSHFDGFAKLENPSVEASRRFVREFLKEAFGFDDLQSAEGVVSFVAGGRVPIVVVPPSDESLDRRSRVLSTDRSRSPAFALQDYLNDKEDALWGLVTNGVVVRLMRDNASLTRPAYIEADLAQIFANEDAASFALLWLLIHRSRFGKRGTPAADCALEQWREAGSREGQAARDRLAGQVKLALKCLGSGFLEANPELATKLRSGEIGLTDWFNELLRLVYRLIFLMVAEDRNLLHPEKARAEARRLYADGYSLACLRTQCVRAAAWDRHFDRFEGVKIVFRALARGEERLALPALGGLFAADQLPHLGAARLSNRAFMEALYRLSWLPEKAGIVPVNWRAMEAEELGSVYESLLELQPQLGEDGRTLLFALEAAEQRGNQRKTTGSYYTPDSLVETLLDTALDPVLDQAEATDDPEAALLKLSVIDPACGSGHFLLAAARRIATPLARIRADGTPSAADFRQALRDVARSCLYGVDRNPMAVELAKVALWIETVDPGLPLGFFDAQIRCGDALLGVFDLSALEAGIPDDAYRPLTGDSREAARHYLLANRDAKAGQGRLDFVRGGGALPPGRMAAGLGAIRAMPEGSVAEVERKEAAFEAWKRDPARWATRVACDLYVAAFLLPKAEVPQVRGRPMVPTTADVRTRLAGGQVYGPMEGAAVDSAWAASAFHWPLEFPDVMIAKGGFDVVLGNPPWERIKLQEQEFFAGHPVAEEPNAAARARAIAKLAEAPEGSASRALYEAFQRARRQAEAISAFARVPGEAGGRFPFTGTGDVNTYALFAELFLNLMRAGGRAGLIVPTGIATDATTAPFFGHLVATQRLAGLIDFENRERLFPSVDSRMKFSLLTLGSGVKAADFAFFLTDPAQLADPQRRFTLSPAQIARINPNTRTAPVFRSRADAALTAAIYDRVPVLIEEGKGPAGNPWGVSFMRMFDMSNDSDLFRTAAQLAAEGWRRDGADWVGEQEDGAPARMVPLYEAKMIHQFDHRWATYEADGETSRDVTPAEKQDPAFEPSPRYWVPQAEVASRLTAKGWHRGWLMGWRDVTNATNERTVIAGAIPAVAVNHKLPLFFVNNEPARAAALMANWLSLTLDFVARQKIGGTSLTYFYLKQFPILPPAAYDEAALAFIVPRVRELTCTSHAMAPFARDLGYDGPPLGWNEDRRAQLRAELDAWFARAYGLSRDELRYILDPADALGPDYPSETFRVLKANEIRSHGEYRTARLILKAWDRMDDAGRARAVGA